MNPHELVMIKFGFCLSCFNNVFVLSFRVSGKSLVKKRNVQILLLLLLLLLLPQIRNLSLLPITLVRTDQTLGSAAKIVNPVQLIRLILDTGVVAEVGPSLPVMPVVEDETEETSEKIKKMKKKVMRKAVGEIAALEEDEEEVFLCFLFLSCLFLF